MSMNEKIAPLLKDKEKINQLLMTLDDIAASYDLYGFGLPINDEQVLIQMREAVLDWITNHLEN